jgi:hypothetical protein
MRINPYSYACRVGVCLTVSAASIIYMTYQASVCATNPDEAASKRVLASILPIAVVAQIALCVARCLPQKSKVE